MIKVKDLVEYLSKLPQDVEVDLDKDGWQDNHPDPQVVIGRSGLFYVYDDNSAVIINN